MAKKKHESATPATEWLKKRGIAFEEFSYDYVEHGGTAECSRQTGLNHHSIVKTLIMEDDNSKPLVVLMHGDREVSTKNLARQTGRKSVNPCSPSQAQRNSGYQVGGTSPFGTRRNMPVYVESSVLGIEKIFINGGRRGYILGIPSRILITELGAIPVDVGIRESHGQKHEPAL